MGRWQSTLVLVAIGSSWTLLEEEVGMLMARSTEPVIHHPRRTPSLVGRTTPRHGSLGSKLAKTLSTASDEAGTTLEAGRAELRAFTPRASSIRYCVTQLQD